MIDNVARGTESNAQKYIKFHYIVSHNERSAVTFDTKQEPCPLTRKTNIRKALK